MRGTGKTWLLLVVTAAKLGIGIGNRPVETSLYTLDENSRPRLRLLKDGRPRGKGKTTKDWQL